MYSKEAQQSFIVQLQAILRHLPPIIANSQNHFTVTGLDRGTLYDVYITASNQYGNGEAGDMFLF